ncbi:MAG: NUDIX hydrolase, partial [Janthinobacterium sp.]
MIEFKKYPGINSDGGSIVLTIASGPVIILDDGKVLLDKHGDDQFWKFPGGKLRDDNSVRDNAKREVKEELGVEVDLIGDPFIICFDKEKNGMKEYVVLIHYLARIVGGEINPGRDVREWAWHDINNLPDDCAPNIKPAVEYFK